MSRYAPPDYRGPRDRSRSPPRFPDRRASAASIYENRPAGPPRTASEVAPRGPRSQFDGSRPSPAPGSGPAPGPRPGYSSLRDAPPLGSGDRGRSYRDREYDRRDRVPSPRERSPPRDFKEPRDYPPRDLDISRARRESRDGPPSAGSNYSDGQPFSSTAPFRGGFVRGRGRGEFSSFRGGRGGRSNLDERDLFQRNRSPPPRWGRDASRDSRDSDRRDDRRFNRREDERRPPDWADRERERDRDRELDRGRRDVPASRAESRPLSEAPSGVNSSNQAPPINPARLALIESTVGDPTLRRPSMQQDAPLAREPRRDQLETPSYLNGRAETTANRYVPRDSSPPTQAPPVPAFTLSFAPSAGPPSIPSQTAPPSQATKAPQEPKLQAASTTPAQTTKMSEEQKAEAPIDAPAAPKIPPPGPKAQRASPPPAAPRAPRALESDHATTPNSRLQGVRSLENLSGPTPAAASLGPIRGEPTARPSLSPATIPAMPYLNQPVSPHALAARPSDLGAPTGPRASRTSPAQASVSPRPPFASPRSEIGSFPGQSAIQRTPPPSAPSGPRNRSFSVSPKVATSTVPTAPKGSRGPPIAPRGPERGPLPPGRVLERLGPASAWPPSAPRGLQWNQWRKPGTSPHDSKTIPAKRDVHGDEKGRPVEQGAPAPDVTAAVKFEDRPSKVSDAPPLRIEHHRDGMDIDKEPPRRQLSMMSSHSHSAAQSFFGKPSLEGADEDTGVSDTGQEMPSTSEEDESDLEDDLTLFNAKFERQKRNLEAQKFDLSSRNYRATTPLESIARLARISTRDLERVNEMRDQDMDIDESSVRRNTQLHPPTTHSSDSGEAGDLLTPKGDDDHRVAIRSSDDSSDSIRKIRRPTPEPVNLPYLLKDPQPPFDEIEAFQESLKRHEESKADMLSIMEEEIIAEEDAEADIENIFAEEYYKWREECEELDRQREELEKLERQQSLEPGPEPDAPVPGPINPVMEGRRLHKFSSEYALEQVLKQSEETARIEQERQEREAKKNQADMEKEAIVPNQMTEDEIKRSTFIDFNRYRDPESLTIVFSYEPRADTFTETEQQIFIAAFKDTPKKWGEIASLLPGRTYEDCIRHYYANKWDGRFRDRTKKLKAGGRRGRGGARGPRAKMGLMADLTRVEDLLSTENMSEKGRPRRAAAPTTFAEKEAEAKANLLGPSPAKKSGPGSKTDSNGENGSEKPGKRQKRTGEKPGRKPKANQPLLAPASQASPGKPFPAGVPTKEDLARVQKMEDASLLAGFHSGHHSMVNADGQVVYAQESYMHGMPMPEEPERPKPLGQTAPAKQGASSYWSVPEQNDFVKYIHHFGRDFAAIAAHMGTKTHTMIKNHYQRQVDGGNRPELERAAMEADERRVRGEELGPPPTPTPIQKRKYENPQPAPQRPLAPLGDAMDTDDVGPGSRVQLPKHTSPPQYQQQPRFNSTHSTPTQVTRVAPSPLQASAAPVSSQAPATSHSRPMQHPIGARITFLSDTRSENRQPAPSVSNFRATQDTPRSQPAQPSRTVTDAPDPLYIQKLRQEQDHALRMQEQFSQAERMDSLQHQTALHRNPSQGSPLNAPMHNPPEGKPAIEERIASPQRPFFPSVFQRPLQSTSALGGLGGLSSLGGRPSFNPSPPKREGSRPSSVSAAPPTQPQPAPAPPSEPKRSNVMALLNSEPDEPKPVKRESVPSAQQRTNSPAPPPFSHSTPAAPLSNLSTMRREPSFGQPSVPQSHFPRAPFGQQSSTPAPAPPTLKHEPSSGSGSLSQKPDWAARVHGQTTQAPSSSPTLERELRQHYPPYRSVLGASIGQSRANPSPPPLSAIAHSRTPSLTAQASHPPPDHSRSGMPGQQQPPSHQPAQPLQPNPYAGQLPPFSQQSGQTQNQSHHSHNSSIGGSYPSLHHRGMSRDDHIAQERAALAAVQREREDNEILMRQRDAMEAERRREEHYLVQRQQERERELERERERHQSLHRPPPPTLQPPLFGGSTFGRGGNLDLRSQSRMETEMAMREEQERQRQDSERRRQELMMRDQREADEFRRRQDESMFRRHTPLGGAFGGVPPQPPQPRR